MRKTPALFLAATAAIAYLTACNSVKPEQAADTIYTGGTILTVNDSQPTAEAVAVKDGKILMVGTTAEVESMHKADSTKVVDLAGKTLVPGFVDAHSHFMFALDMPTQANVSAPPVGPVKSIPDMIAALKETQKRLNIQKGDWILGWGYDGNELAEGREATRDDLDPAFPDNPVMVIHVSGHGAVLNSLALNKFNITAKTPTPPGGVILRKPGGNEPSGLLMETAYLPVFAQLPKPSEAEMLDRINAAQQIYASNGYTTAQEGATHSHDVDFLKKAASQKRLYIDVVSLPIFIELADVLARYPANTWGSYDNRFKLGGVKTFFDGSPQGKTAFFTKPYLTPGPAGQKNWHGEPGFSEAVFMKYMKPLYDNNLRPFNHCNGDASIDMFLDIQEKMHGKPELRPVVIHSQFVRPDQLDRYVKLGVIPAMYPMHTYFFGDVHLKNLGMERASFMSPTQSALKKGLHVTLHSDFNVLPLDPMMIMWTAMNRTTRTGVVLGAGERLTAQQALKAITLDSAYEYMEEGSKGSIEPGKLADFAILSANPITTTGDAIKNIKVVETIKEGKLIYKAPSN
jgi:predicted amidohydrolase YtcJ